jgi:glycosyltransferase involved in cell wall biosynthesis
VGGGPSLDSLHRDLGGQPGARVHFSGVLHGPFLVSADKAMNAFAFASLSETQGMGLVEAMAAEVPVVALAAPGTDEVVRDGENGRLLAEGDEAAFADALRAMAERPREAREASAGRRVPPPRPMRSRARRKPPSPRMTGSALAPGVPRARRRRQGSERSACCAATETCSPAWLTPRSRDDDPDLTRAP